MSRQFLNHKKKSLNFYMHKNWYNLFAKHDYWIEPSTIPEWFTSKAHVKSMGRNVENYIKVKMTIQEL